MDYEIGDKVEAQREEEDDEWEPATIKSIDPEDIRLTYEVRFERDFHTKWIKEKNIRRKLTDLIAPKKLSSQGVCPLCGHTGMIGFNLFRCSNTNCRNSGK